MYVCIDSIGHNLPSAKLKGFMLQFFQFFQGGNGIDVRILLTVFIYYGLDFLKYRPFDILFENLKLSVHDLFHVFSCCIQTRVVFPGIGKKTATDVNVQAENVLNSHNPDYLALFSVHQHGYIIFYFDILSVVICNLNCKDKTYNFQVFGMGNGAQIFQVCIFNYRIAASEKMAETAA